MVFCVSFSCCHFSVANSCLTLCDHMDHSTPGFPVLHYLLEFTQTQTQVHWVGNESSHPLSPPPLPAFNLSQHQGLFQWVSSSHQVPKYWSFSFSISSPNEYSGLISFRIDWFDLAVQESSPAPQFKSINSSELSLLMQSIWCFLSFLLLNKGFKFLRHFLKEAQLCIITKRRNNIKMQKK